MANRYWNQFKGSLERGVVSISGSFVVNSSGVITSQAGQGATVSKTGTGQYTITLQDAYNGLIFPDVQIQSATTQNLNVQCASNTIATGTATPVLVFNLVSAATGNAADFTAVATVYYDLKLKNSTV